MYKIKRKFGTKELNTYIGKGTVITGSIQCQGSLRINGIVKGDLNAEGDIIIGKPAEITGNASAKNISVGGFVEGNLIAAGIIRILSTARLTGDIEAGALIADRGGYFDGKCSIRPAPKNALEAVFQDRGKKNNPLVNAVANT